MAMSIKEKILNALKDFHQVMRENTLQTLEEVEASPDDNYWVGAGAVAELNNNLQQQPEFIYDSTGKITGYKTQAGADAVFPFSDLPEIKIYNLSIGQNKSVEISSNTEFLMIYTYRTDSPGQHAVWLFNGGSVRSMYVSIAVQNNQKLCAITNSSNSGTVTYKVFAVEK